MIESYLESSAKTEVCILELYRNALGNFGNPDRRTSNEIADILRNGLGWSDSGNKTKRFGEFGTQRYFIKPTASSSDDEGFMSVTEQMKLPFKEMNTTV